MELILPASAVTSGTLGILKPGDLFYSVRRGALCLCLKFDGSNVSAGYVVLDGDQSLCVHEVNRTSGANVSVIQQPTSALFTKIQPGGAMSADVGSLLVGAEGAFAVVRLSRAGDSWDAHYLSIATWTLHFAEPRHDVAFSNWQLVARMPDGSDQVVFTTDHWAT